MSNKPSGMVNADELARLLRAIDDSKLVEVEIDFGDLHVRVRKEGAPTGAAALTATPAPVVREEPGAEAPARPAGRRIELRSPMLGVFYRCPEPGAPPFVEVGKSVRAQDNVGLIEVMKLFNQVQAGADGRIVEILVEDAAMVEHGQILMIIEAPE